MKYQEMQKSELSTILIKEKERYENFKSLGLNLDMSRGKPCKEQLDLSMGLLDEINSVMELGKIDPRNYGGVDGLFEAKKLFGELMGVSPEEIIVGDNSSLNLMYDSIMRYYCFGVLGSSPWSEIHNRKWICVVPGYDRHFAVTEEFGFESVTVNMLEDGPDMDKIEELVADESVKGIWCVPKYSNPEGKTFSDEVVKRFARLKPAAKDFRIFWDNAYGVHDIAENGDVLLNLVTEAKNAGNPNIVLMFGSTSKISFAGAGISYLCASKENIDDIKKRMSIQTIGPNKINQLAHVRYFKSVDNILLHMKKHAQILRPKFYTVLSILKEELQDLGICDWHNPKGGYFVSVDVLPGTAKRTVELAKGVGVIFTPAGSTYPKKQDPFDSNLRIAPSLPPVKELETAMRVFACATKIAAIEKLLAE